MLGVRGATVDESDGESSDMEREEARRLLLDDLISLWLLEGFSVTLGDAVVVCGTAVMVVPTGIVKLPLPKGTGIDKFAPLSNIVGCGCGMLPRAMATDGGP